MSKKFSILNKSNGSDAHPFIPTTDGEDRVKEKDTTKHTWKIFKVISKTWKSGKGKRDNNNPNKEVGNENNSSSGHVRDEIGMNPFTDSTEELDLNATSKKNTADKVEAGKCGSNLLNKMNLQKLMGLFASANRKRQELLKHKANKNDVHLEKAKTFIAGQGPFKQEEGETDSASFLIEEEQDLCDIKYEDSTPKSSQELLKGKANKNEVQLDKAKTFIFGQGPFKQEEEKTDPASFLTEEEQDVYDIKYEDSSSTSSQELLKHKANKNEVHLDKAKTFIFGQGPFKQEEEKTDPAPFLTEEEQDVYDIKYEDNAPATSGLSKSTMSVTNIPRTFIDCEQFGSTSTPANSLQDQAQTTSNAPETDSSDDLDGDAAQNNTLDLLQSVCDKLVSHDFNDLGNSSGLNINAKVVKDVSNSESVLDMDLESVSSEEDSECESSNSPKNSAHVNESTERPVEDLKKEDFLGPPKNEGGFRTMEDERKSGAIGDAKDLGKVQIKLKTIQNLYTNSLSAKGLEALPVIKESSQSDVSFNEESLKEERTENQKTYFVVEDDIKCMIKELLDETKAIKETVVSSGITEEIEPPFTYAISQNLAVYGMCRRICEELISAAVTFTHSKTFNIPNRKNIFTSKEVTRTAVSDVKYIMNILLEQVVDTWHKKKFDPEPNKQFVSVNYCLINECPLHNSKIYSAGSKFWQTAKNHNPRRVCTPRLPLVTVRNLSSTPRMSVFKTDEKLMNRMRKSTGLLHMLYEEMRDYSYQNTSRLFNDLYETINLLDLSTHVVEHPKPNRLIEKKTASQVNSEPVVNPVAEEKEVHEDIKLEEPGTSCPKSTSKANITPVNSGYSSCSSEITEDAEASGILPNLKYTYVSEEEINSAEEIKKIETNAIENSMRNADLRTADEEFAMELDATDDEATKSNNDDEETPK